MMQSGLVLDFYDDDATVLRSIYPTEGDIPGAVKTAHVLSWEERQQLPDDVYALVMVDDEGHTSRKYACSDAGNTMLAVEYFLRTHDKLPAEAQKVAASNLIEACRWYDLLPSPELSKVAGLLSAGFNAATTLPAIKERAAHGLHQAANSEGLITPKHAEVSGTSLMPLQSPTDSPTKTTNAVIRKVARVGHLVSGKAPHGGEAGEELEKNDAAVGGKQPAPIQHKQMKPYVNVQGAEPPSPSKMKVSSITALRGRYPLDSYAQVKAASAYFDEYGMHFSPEDRHEYCVNLVKQASVLQIPVSDVARRYGSEKYAAAEDVDLALDLRRRVLSSESSAFLDKLAAVRETVDPEVFALALGEFDKTAGIQHLYDRDVYDPFFSTFGFTKEATFSESIGNDYVNEFQLRQCAQANYAFMKERFGEDLADEFRKDPIGIFKSLPVEQKKIIMRLAADPQPGRGES
jgi:hypothetical protein